MEQENPNGFNLDQNIMLEIMQQKLAAGAVREAQLETAIQQTLNENQELKALVEELKAQIPEDEDTQEEG